MQRHPVRNRHHVAEVILRCLELKLSGGVIRLRAHVEHSTELGIAMGVG